MKLSVFLNLTILAIGAACNVVADDNDTPSFRDVGAKIQSSIASKEDCRTYLTTGSYNVYNHEKTLQDGLTVNFELTQEDGENGGTKFNRKTKVNQKNLFLEALEYSYDPAGLSEFKLSGSFKIKSCEKDPDSDMVGVDYENTIDDQTLQTMYFEKQ